MIVKSILWCPMRLSNQNFRFCNVTIPSCIGTVWTRKMKENIHFFNLSILVSILFRSEVVYKTDLGSCSYRFFGCIFINKNPYLVVFGIVHNETYEVLTVSPPTQNGLDIIRLRKETHWGPRRPHDGPMPNVSHARVSSWRRVFRSKREAAPWRLGRPPKA